MTGLNTFETNNEDGLADLWEAVINCWQFKRRDLFRSYGITANQFTVIHAVAAAKRQHAPNQQFLVSYTGINKMVVSQTLDILEQKRMLRRIRAFIDKRQHTIRLSASSKLLLENIIPELRTLEEEFLHPLSGEERSQFRGLLAKLAA